MDDLISRQAAIDALKGMAVPLYKDPACEDIWERDRTLDNAIDAIRGLPSAQPEIIHCHDCKHWQSEEFIGNNNVHTLGIACLPCKNWLTGGDWYCGSAERKDI